MSVHDCYFGAVLFVVTDRRIVGNESSFLAEEMSGPVLNQVVRFSCTLNRPASSIKSYKLVFIL